MTANQSGLGFDTAPGTRVMPAAWRARPRRRLRFAFVLWPLYSVYTRRLRCKVCSELRPRHVAVILDGNRRWASLAGLHEPGAGHRRGADKLAELLSWCADLSIDELTVWALSADNLARPDRELAAPSRSSQRSCARWHTVH